jgi:hypothetical protein
LWTGPTFSDTATSSRGRLLDFVRLGLSGKKVLQRQRPLIGARASNSI